MNHRQCRTILLTAAAIFGTQLALSAQDEGVKQIEQLIKKANAQIDSINEAKQQVQKTMDAYNQVLDPNVKDRRDAYKKLQKEMSASEKKRAEVSARSTEMNAEADKLFKSWEGSTSAIQSPDLRERSVQRLKRTQDRFSELRQTGRQAADLYTPIMKTLQDQVAYLGHDLNAGAVAALKPDADKLNAQAKDLYAAIDKVTAAAAENRSKLNAE